MSGHTHFDPFVVPRGATGLAARLRPAPLPASARRMTVEYQARAQTRYRLRMPVADGDLSKAAFQYLHAMDFSRFATRETDAWIGTLAQLQRVRDRFPQTRTLIVVRVPPERPGDAFPSRRSPR